MSSAPLDKVLGFIHRISATSESNNRSDSELLDEFECQKDQAAFTALVKRHGPMVMGVCRHVLQHHQDAEDAYQATFLVLARNAASIRKKAALVSWLHGVAYRTALSAKKIATRRRTYEARMRSVGQGSPFSDLAWREVQSILDQEVQHLPEKYRAPFLLCYLEGQSRAEAARQLGMKEGTVWSRLGQARALLKQRLARRGITLSAVLSAAALSSGGSTAAASPILVSGTVTAALEYAAGKPIVAGAASGKVAALAEGITKAMTMTKLNAGLTLVLGLSVLTAGAGLAAYQAIPSKPSEPESAAPAKAQAEDRPLSSPAPGQETRAQSQNRTDRYGDPLPPGALARMGTMRLRHTHPNLLTTAISSDGKILASGGWNEIRLWDTATGKLLREIVDEGNRTKSWCPLLFAPDGRWLAGACRDSVCIWDTATGRRLQEFPAKGQTIACSPDGKLLAASLENGSIAVWNTVTGKKAAEFRRGHADRIHSVAFTADGTGLVTMSRGPPAPAPPGAVLVSTGRLCLWDLAESKLRKAVDIPPSLGLALSPDGQTLAITPREGPTSLCDTTTGKERVKLQGGLARGFGLAFSPDGKTLATNATGPRDNLDETTVALWDAMTGKFLRRFRLPTRHVASLHFSPDGRTLLTVGRDEPVIRLWDTATGKPALQWPAHTGEAMSLAFTPDGRSLVSGGLDGTVRLWEVSTGRQVRELAGHRWRCAVVAVAPNGKVILSGGADGCIRLQDPDGRQLRRMFLDGPPEEMTNLGRQVLALAVTPDSKTAVTWSFDPNTQPLVYHLWDLATGKALSNLPYKSTVWNAPQFSGDARLVLEQFEERADALAALTDAGKGGGYGPGRPAPLSFLLREVATGKEILRLRQPDGLGGVQAFAPDGRTVLAVGVGEERAGDSWRCDSALHFWELATRKERLTIPCGSGQPIQQVAFAPDGRTVATARYDGTIQLWDLRTGKELPRRALAGTEVSCLSFSPDSRLLASGQRDGTILVWDLTPRPPTSPHAPPPVGEGLGRGGKGERGLGQLEQWWADLAGEDARRAYAAVWELSAEPPQALRLFRDRLRQRLPTSYGH